MPLGDITLVNEKLAVAIAVNSSPPWAIPKGALIDAAPVVHGSISTTVSLSRISCRTDGVLGPALVSRWRS